MKSYQAYRRFFPIFILILLSFQACSTTQRARIYLDTSNTTSGGMVISNFSTDEVDAYIQSFILQKGYEIAFADSSQSWIQQELGEGSSLIWLAEKPGEPAILFLSAEKILIVSFVQNGLLPSTRLKDYVNILYRILAAKFGDQNVHMRQ